MTVKLKTRQIKSPALMIIIAIIIVAVMVAIFSNRTPATHLESDGEKLIGIDVSSHNGKIDWDRVGENIDFAFIRVGYRGYSTGEINIDKNAKHNIKKATKNGIPVGVYFYSQATSHQEAVEEAQFVLDVIDGLDVALPVVIDFEYASDSDGNLVGRLYDADLTSGENTSIINAFCKTVEDAGYQSGVYASRSVFERQIDTDDLSENAIIWVAEYNKQITYKKDFDIWQYSNTGTLDGIGSKHVDLNYWYVKEEKSDVQ